MDLEFFFKNVEIDIFVFRTAKRPNVPLKCSKFVLTVVALLNALDVSKTKVPAEFSFVALIMPSAL